MDENEPLEWYERLFLQVVVCYMAAAVVMAPLLLGLYAVVGWLLLALLVVLWPLWLARSIGEARCTN